MTPLDIALHDEAKRLVAREEIGRRDPPVCTLDRCRCPTCGVTELVLRSALRSRRVPQGDLPRVTVRANDFAGGAYPYVASVRVDDKEVFRIHARPDEALEPDVVRDVIRALRRTK